MSDPGLVKVWIESDEWYPVYGISLMPKEYDEACVIPVSLLERHEKATKEFKAVQEILRGLVGD